MEASDVELVRMMVRDATREMRSDIEMVEARIGDRINTVADSVASALLAIATHTSPIEDEEPPTDGDGSGEPAGDEEPATEGAIDEGGGEIVVTTDGEVLEATPDVEVLTPAEALDAIEPERTHLLLRRIF